MLFIRGANAIIDMFCLVMWAGSPEFQKDVVTVFVLNIPNILTLVRMGLIPVFIVLYYNGLTKAAFAVYVAACVTDALDGYLARKHNQVTAFMLAELNGIEKRKL